MCIRAYKHIIQNITCDKSLYILQTILGICHPLQVIVANNKHTLSISYSKSGK